VNRSADAAELRHLLNEFAVAQPDGSRVAAFLETAVASFGGVVGVYEDRFLSAIGQSRHFLIEFRDADALESARIHLSGIDLGQGRLMVLVPKAEAFPPV